MFTYRVYELCLWGLFLLGVIRCKYLISYTSSVFIHTNLKPVGRERMLPELPGICWSLCNMHLQQSALSSSPRNHDLRLLLPAFHSPIAIWQQWLCLQHQFPPVKCFQCYPKNCLVWLSCKTPPGSVFPWASEVMNVSNTSVNLRKWQCTEEILLRDPLKPPHQCLSVAK